MSWIKRRLARLVGLSFIPKLGDWLNGKKTVLGAIALLLYVLDVIPTLFPECAVACPAIAIAIHQGLEFLGVSLVGLGVTHKALKK
jgi:hypothetical protein